MKGWRVFLLGTAALAALFVFNIWWVGDVPDEYRRLQSATPVENSWRWMRDTFSSEARPRHLGSGVPEAARSPSDDELPVASARPERSMLPAALVLAEGISPVRSDAHPDVRPETPRTVSVVPPRTEGAAPSPKAERRPPVIVAQAPAKIDKPSPQSEAAIGELERLVAELVSHYESGNIDGFVGLFDTASVGVIEAMGVRRDYKEFFEDTESRQLRLRSIAWDSRSLPERAQGEANLSATYKDRPERLDRVVKVELSIAWRAGRPRIAHLSLFPRE